MAETFPQTTSFLFDRRIDPQMSLRSAKHTMVGTYVMVLRLKSQCQDLSSFEGLTRKPWRVKSWPWGFEARCRSDQKIWWELFATGCNTPARSQAVLPYACWYLGEKKSQVGLEIATDLGEATKSVRLQNKLLTFHSDFDVIGLVHSNWKEQVAQDDAVVKY